MESQQEEALRGALDRLRESFDRLCLERPRGMMRPLEISPEDAIQFIAASESLLGSGLLGPKSFLAKVLGL